MQANISIGTITLIMQELDYEWSLPTWTAEPDEARWEGLLMALLMTQRVEHIEVARAWLPALKPSVEEQLSDGLGTLFSWLRAASRTATAPSYFTWRYPDASDAVALAQLVHATQALSVAGAYSTLGATFDVTLAVFANRWGSLLEACSVVVEARRSMTGAVLTALYGDGPLIVLLATGSPLIARDVLVMVLDALADLHYPMVNLLLQPASPYVALAVSLGFESIGQVQQMLIYS